MLSNSIERRANTDTDNYKEKKKEWERKRKRKRERKKEDWAIKDCGMIHSNSLCHYDSVVNSWSGLNVNKYI